MKKTLPAIVLFLFAFTPCFTQEHMTFKNIPIDGNYKEFVKKMKGDGGEVILEREGVVVLKYKFTGKPCELFVLYTPKTNIVWKVAVSFDKYISWKSIKSDYFDFKDLYTKKYGNPDSFEFFSDPYYEGDGYEMQAIRNEKCTYTSFFEAENGYISVKIGTTESIFLSYEDKINSNISTKEEEERDMGEI